MACPHDRVIQINGKTSDMRSVSVPHLDLEDYTGSVRIGDIARGDYMNIRLCLGCGVALNFQPMSDDEVKEAFEDV